MSPFTRRPVSASFLTMRTTVPVSSSTVKAYVRPSSATVARNSATGS